MAKFVADKHGTIIGSDDNFFYFDAAGDSHDFPVMLWAKRYRFDEVNSLNVRIRTPAEQILFLERPATEEDRAIAKNPHLHTVVQPSEFITSWLNQNAPGWGFPPACQSCDTGFFLRKRKHAVALRAIVNKMLQGITIPGQKQ